MTLEKLRKKLRNRVQHKNPWDKHVSILSESGTGYSVLLWKYNNHDVKARSKDGNFLLLLRDAIELYLEEMEGGLNDINY